MGAIVTSAAPTVLSRSARLRGALAATDSERRERAMRPAARSRRDWLVDTACFVIAIAGAIYGPAALLESGAEPSSAETALIIAAGALACLAIWLRRRWPVGVAL